MGSTHYACNERCFFSDLPGAALRASSLQPAALDRWISTMADYRAMLDTQRAKREDTSEDALLAARDSYRKKKSL